MPQVPIRLQIHWTESVIFLFMYPQDYIALHIADTQERYVLNTVIITHWNIIAQQSGYKL